MVFPDPGGPCVILTIGCSQEGDPLQNSATALACEGLSGTVTEGGIGSNLGTGDICDPCSSPSGVLFPQMVRMRGLESMRLFTFPWRPRMIRLLSCS